MPPNGTAGLARSAVNGISRLPSPPASTIASTSVATIAEPSPDPRRQPGPSEGCGPMVGVWRRTHRPTSPNPWSAREGLLCRRLTCAGGLHLRPGGRIGTRTRAGDRRDEAGLIQDAEQARLVDPRQGVPADPTDQVRTSQPVEESCGEGVTRTHG